MTESIGHLIEFCPSALSALLAGSPDLARIYIDKQIQAWRKARNTLSSPAITLPAELLLKIFKHVTSPTSHYRDYDPIKEDLTKNDVTWKDFMAITHVCQTWRSIAIGCPDLWSRIIFSSTAIAEEMLARSNGSPLIVNISESNPIIRDKRPGSLQFFERFLVAEDLQELRLCLSETNLDRLLPLLSGNSAAQLQSIFIKRLFDNPSTAEEPAFIAYELPPNLLSFPKPSLQRLHIDKCGIPWDSMQSCISGELLSLKIDNVSQPSSIQFLDLLSQAPNLEDLHLVSALPAISDNQSTNIAVELPKLSSCVIKGSSPAECVHFQQHVSYPTDIVDLRFFPSYQRGFTDGASIDALIHSCGVSVLDSRRSHFNVSFRTSRWHITLCSSPFETPLEDRCFDLPADTPSVTIDLTAGKFETDLQLDYSWLDLLSLPEAKSLSIWAWPRLTQKPAVWFTFFNRHTEITQLVVDTPSTLGLFLALSNSADGDLASVPLSTEHFRTKLPLAQDFRLCLPNLTGVMLLEHAEDMDLVEYIAEMAMLGKFLIIRRECGSQLRKLDLVQCYWMDEDMVVTLGKDADEVHWDGEYMPGEIEDVWDSGSDAGSDFKEFDDE